MAKAKKLPSGNWNVNQYIGTENGKRKFKSFTAPTKKQAEYAAAEYMLTKKEVSSGQMTVYQAIDEYIDSKKNILSPSTIRGYKSIRNNRLKQIGNMRVNNLSRNAIQRAINAESATLSAKTMQNTYALLKSALNQFGADIDAHLPQRTKREMNIPTREEAEVLMAADVGRDLHVAIVLACCCGMRRSEICALTPADIDIERGIIRINKAIVQGTDGFSIKSTKTYAGTRTVPMPERVRQELSGGLPEFRKPNSLTNGFDRLTRQLEKSGQLKKHIRFHDLRHFYASVMLSLSVPDKYAMELMGHASNNMLKNVYQHTMADRKAEIVQMLNNFF